jgi:SAM-dependent methyltransferase
MVDLRGLARVGYRLLFAQADFVRPIVQAPLARDLIGTHDLGTVLDDGAGRGLYTSFALRHAARVVALVYDAGNTAALRRRFAVRTPRGAVPFSLVRGDAARLPFTGAAFDTVLCMEVLEHVPDDGAAAREIGRVLKPGARAVVSVPVPPAPIDDPDHVREGYTPPALDALLAGAGLRVRRRQLTLYAPTQQAMRLATEWRALFRIRAPSVLKLLPWAERLLGDRLPARLRGGPHDQIVVATRAG